MRRLLIGVIVVAAATTARGSQSPADLFRIAGQAYDAGFYTEAALAYDVLLEMGYDRPTVYFNLGNAHFRAGDLGRAIWAYRAASNLAPRDPDIDANLTVARLAARDRIETVPPGFLQQIWRTLARFLTLREGATVVTISWFVLWGALALWLLYPRLRRVVQPVLKVTVTVWALALLVLAARYLETHNTVVAVVVVPETQALSGPGDEFDQVFSGHAGLECVVRGQKSDYALVELANGRVGWIPETDLRRVPPS